VTKTFRDCIEAEVAEAASYDRFALVLEKIVPCERLRIAVSQSKVRFVRARDVRFLVVIIFVGVFSASFEDRGVSTSPNVARLTHVYDRNLGLRDSSCCGIRMCRSGFFVLCLLPTSVDRHGDGRQDDIAQMLRIRAL
jgi:hypothetical protein